MDYCSHNNPHDQGGPIHQPTSASSIPADSNLTSPLHCCCGRLDCAYLKHNNAALEDLEKDLATAARLGQALLQRHETYVSDAEEDRNSLLADMQKLERDKLEMQAQNARIVEENRELLEQLEGLNQAVVTSDAQIKVLTDKLQQTQTELRELAVSAARASELETQLMEMETEQIHLHQQLILTEEEQKSAIQRWKQAESTLRDLQDQLDLLENEAREEREQHVELIQRMERRRQVERELDGAAGRLKGAAAAAAMDRNRSGGTVVSKFVRDILQDNANLQMGIVELRELLENSNQEVENLRDQILRHQPIDEPSEQSIPREASRTRLSEELEAKSSRPVSQEIHVHHHYHTPSSSISSKKDKVYPVRRPKKKRPVISTLMASSAGSQSPRLPMHRAQNSASSTSTIMSQTSVTIPSSHRWSQQSAGVSSLASSPQSAFRSSSIFDVIDQPFESSRPTSPESNGFASPTRYTHHSKRLSDVSMLSASLPSNFQSLNVAIPVEEGIFDANDAETCRPVEAPFASTDDLWVPPAIPEEQEDTIHSEHPVEPLSAELEPEAPAVSPGNEADEDTDPSLDYRPLRRSSSHESLLSISGMDIHTLRGRPSQLIMGLNSEYFARSPRRITSPSASLSSTPPVTSVTNITAGKVSLYNTNRTTSLSLLSSVAATNGSGAAASDALAGDSKTNVGAPSGKAAALGRRVGGWVLGRWGVTPSLTSNDLSSQAAEAGTDASTSGTPATANITAPSTPSKVGATPSRPSPFLARTPGINQKGPIPGFLPPKPAPVSLHPSTLDEESLRESLQS